MSSLLRKVDFHPHFWYMFCGSVYVVYVIPCKLSDQPSNSSIHSCKLRRQVAVGWVYVLVMLVRILCIIRRPLCFPPIACFALCVFVSCVDLVITCSSSFLSSIGVGYGYNVGQKSLRQIMKKVKVLQTNKNKRMS